ncbi:MAG: hypothetical protein SOV24_03570 [Muribaculaceae bacterium]|nr:hypothetical protein [Bacteroidales bacterium]MDY2733427.1 hypothetical protein [Muribaculaceae bacterium]
MIKALNFYIALLVALFALPASAQDSIAEPRQKQVPDGKYIFVPDSLQDDVIRLLSGHSKVVDDVSNLDPNELTVYKGDTIPLILKSWNVGRSKGRFDRKLYNYLFVPKKSFSVGITVSYGELGSKDLDVLDLLSDIDISAHAFSIKPYFQYFVGNNISVGLKLGYYSARGDINSFNVDVDEDINFNLHDISYRSNSYSGAFTFTQYVGLSRRGRIGLFNEIALGVKYGTNNFIRPFNGEIRDTHTDVVEASLNFSPGLQIFVMKNVAFHVSLGAFGFYLKSERQTENGEFSGKRFTSGANFRLNLFNINFGIALCI